MNNFDFKVAIFLATGYEMGETIIIIDLLRRAKVTIDIVSVEKALSVKSSHHVFINCEKNITKINFDDYKMLILPGGKLGVENLFKNELLKAKLVDFAKDNKKIIAAICAAPTILGQLRILNNKKITIYPGINQGLENSIIFNEKVVVDGNIITGKSIGCAFEFTLKIIEILLNKTVSDNVRMELMI